MYPENKFNQTYQQNPATKQCPRCSVTLDSSVTVCPNDGTSLVERFDRDPVFANYEFLGTVGSGGMGVIYKARQVILNKVVAIKTLHPHLSSQAAFRRFQTEGKALSALSHPFIVGVHDFGMTRSGQLYMVIDYVDGETLDSLLKRSGQLSQVHFLNIFIDVCDALIHAHGRSIIHRDIKPSNIMVTRGESGIEEIRMMDFGIAKVISDTETGGNNVTQTGEVIGTATCMSPEQARGGKIDYRSDLYALGCVMYEALANCPPFAGNSPLETMLMHLEKKPLPIREASMGNLVDPRLEGIVFRLLEKDPNDRYQSVYELKDDLVALQRGKFEAQSKNSERVFGKKKAAKSHAFNKILALQIAFVLLSVGVLAYASLKMYELNARSHVAPPVKDPPFHYSTVTSVKKDLDRALADEKTEITINSALADPAEAGLESFQDKARFAKVTSLTFRNSPYTDADLDNLRDLPLVTLNLEGTAAKNCDFITTLTDLRDLQLDGLQISQRALHNFAKLPVLEHLSLRSSNITDSDVPLLAALKHLKTLKLNSTNITLDGFDNLLEKTNCEEIHYTPRRDLLKKITWLTGKPMPIDERRPRELLLAGKALIKEQKFAEANIVLESAIIKTENITELWERLAGSLEARGDCLFSLKKPNAGLFLLRFAYRVMYGHGMKNLRSAQLANRIAMVYETMPGDGIAKAVSWRNNANDCLKSLTEAELKDGAPLRTANWDLRHADAEKARKAGYRVLETP